MDVLSQELGRPRTRVKIAEDKGLFAVYWSLYFFVRSSKKEGKRERTKDKEREEE